MAFLRKGWGLFGAPAGLIGARRGGFERGAEKLTGARCGGEAMRQAPFYRRVPSSA